MKKNLPVPKIEHKMIEAQDLKCGDVFSLKGRMYITLMSQTDSRHTSTTITAIYLEDTKPKNLERITAIVAFRTYRVLLVNKIPLELNVVRIEAKDISQDEVDTFVNRRSYL